MTAPADDPATVYAQACALQAAGDYPAAEQRLREVLQRAPLHVEALRALADCLRHQQRDEAADTALRLANKAAVAQSVRAALALAGTPIEAKTEPLLRRTIAQYPQSPEPYAALVDWLRRTGKWREAWELCRQALQVAGMHGSLQCRLDAFEGERPPSSAEEPTPIPFRMVEDLLGPDQRQELLAFAKWAQPALGQSLIGGEGLNEEMRRSRTVRVNAAIQAMIEPLVRAQARRFYRGLGLAAEPTGHVEMEFTAHNDGDFYRYHQDDSLDAHYALRRVSYVYYFHRQPRGFEGGELALYDRAIPGDAPLLTRYTRLPAVDNQLVLFPSHAWHEVLPVRCASKAYDDGRFTIVGWVLADPTREE